MTKQRARERKRQRLERQREGPQTPTWHKPLFIFGFMLIVMGVFRIRMEGAAFGPLDVLFVVLFAATMALFAYFRPSTFR